MRGALAVCALLAPGAAAADTRALVAVDSYVATTPDASATSVADVALSARLDWRADEAPRGVIADWVERESLVDAGNDPRRELQQLAYTDRSIAHLTLRAGRFRAPGGTWLTVDGAYAAYRSADDAVEVGAFAGSRAFTSGRVDTLLASSPSLLPLVGGALAWRGALAQGSLAYTFTYDRIDLDLGGEAPGGPGEQLATSQKREHYVDGELLGQLGEHVFATGGVNVGDRYLATYPLDPTQLTGDPKLDAIFLGSQAAYALFDAARASGVWRFTATAAVLHASLGGLGAADARDAAALAPITGSFVEGSERLRYRPRPELRFDLRIRARVRTDGTRAERAQLAASYRAGAFAADAMIGVDDEHAGTAGMDGQGLVSSRSLLYRASVGRRTDTLELAGGAAAVSALGSELAAVPGDDPNDQRAPYTLEARTYAFASVFAHARGWFGGVDGELDLHGQGMRILAQLGWTR